MLSMVMVVARGWNRLLRAGCQRQAGAGSL